MGGAYNCWTERCQSNTPNDIADSEQYVCYDGSSKQNGGGQAAILRRHLGSDIINLAETFIFVGRIVHILWPKRP